MPEITIKVIIPVVDDFRLRKPAVCPLGYIQKLLIILDSPVSGTGQAQSRASLARNDKKVIATQSPSPGQALPTKVALDLELELD